MMPDEAAAIRLADLVDALEFVSVSQLDENQAWLYPSTGRIVFVSDSIDPEEDLPENPEAVGYLAIPHRRHLDLGKPLAISFVDAELPEHAAQARDFFRRKGAYRHFKHLLQSAGALEKWYAYEERATRDAIRRWCEEVGVQIVEKEPHG
ncbi:UPF0158 family protein [Sphingomonas oryzagri]